MRKPLRKIQEPIPAALFDKRVGKSSVPSIVIVGWKGMILEVVRSLAGNHESINVLDTAEDIEQALVKIRKTPPDVILTGITPGELDPSILIERIESELNMKIPVLVLTLFEEPSVILKVMNSKASGYLILAKTKREELISAVYAAKNNQIVLGPQAWNVLHAVLIGKIHGLQGLEIPSLSSRELQVLRLLAEGFSNKEIADRLMIGKRTVQVHVAHILTKLGVTSRTGAVSYAWRRLLANNPTIGLSEVSKILS